MQSWISEFLSKTEPIVSKFRVPIAAGTLMVVLISGIVLTGGEKEPSSTVTTSEGEVAVNPVTGQPEQAPQTIETAGATSAAKTTAQAGTVVAKKGGITVTNTPGGVPVADLFTPAENRIGITDTGGLFGKGQITLCGHAATTFGPAFNTAPEDLDVYWKALNDAGGVHGRNVVVSWENDNYDPATAVQAATACKAKNPFILLGGIGFEQIPAVRKYAEDNHLFYFHHIAVSDAAKKYSFAPLPTVERVGTMAGDWVRRRFPDKKVGIIYRDSEWWTPGKEEFIKALGKKPVAQQGVIKNQGSYQAQILAMQQAGADLVFAWENALAQSAMIREANDLQYRPQWIVFPFNLVTDTLGNDAMNPVLHGIATWPAYSPGDYGGPFAEYADEIKRFEAAYAKHRPGAPLTDIHWMTWLAWKSIHYLFDQCGRDCTRNKVVGVMISQPYNYDLTRPNCPIDFTRNGREGGYWSSMFEAYRRPNGSIGWRHIQHCKESWS